MDETQRSAPLTENKLRFGYWFITHKLLLKNVLIVVLFFLNLIFWGFIIYSLIISYGSTFSAYQQMRNDIAFDRFVNTAGVLSDISPRDIQTVSIDTFFSTENRLDVIVLLRNPNKKWFATFNYSLKTPEGNTPIRKGFIMPGEQKYLMDLDLEISQVQDIELTNIIWTRENNYPEINSLRNKFSILNSKYTPKGGEDGLTANRASFTIKNDSNYNYYRPAIQIFLKSGVNIVAVHTVTIDSLMSAKSEFIDVRWFEDIGNVQTISVVPDINFLSEDSYISF